MFPSPSSPLPLKKVTKPCLKPIQSRDQGRFLLKINNKTESWKRDLEGEEEQGREIKEG
jgi:hypothetical protein